MNTTFCFYISTIAIIGFLILMLTWAFKNTANQRWDSYIGGKDDFCLAFILGGLLIGAVFGLVLPCYSKTEIVPAQVFKYDRGVVAIYDGNTVENFTDVNTFASTTNGVSKGTVIKTTLFNWFKGEISSGAKGLNR